MTNLMKDIGKFEQTISEKKKNKIPMAYHKINSRWATKSQLGKPEEDISEGLISGESSCLETYDAQRLMRLHEHNLLLNQPQVKWQTNRIPVTYLRDS